MNMLQTPGHKTIQSCTHYEKCFWRWEDKTLEGVTIPKEMWEHIAIEILTELARKNMRYSWWSLPGIGLSGKLNEDELHDFIIAIKDDGVYVNYTLHGEPKERITKPRNTIYMNLVWIGVLFSSDLQELINRLNDAEDKISLFMAYGFKRVWWRGNEATYANRMYYVTLNDERIIKMNF